MATMNEHLTERFGRSKKFVKTPTAQAQVWIKPQQLNEKVRQYFDPPTKPVAGGHWLKRPEIPSSAEVLDKDTGGSTSSSEVELLPNRKKGAWESKGKLPLTYLIHLLTECTQTSIWGLITSYSAKMWYGHYVKLSPRSSLCLQLRKSNSTAPLVFTTR